MRLSLPHPMCRRALRACACLFFFVLWPAVLHAELLPGETKADSAYNEHANELRVWMQRYSLMAQGLTDAPKVRIEVESVIHTAENTLTDAARRLTEATEKYQEKAQATHAEQAEKIALLQAQMNEYMMQTPPDEAGILRTEREIEAARQELDDKLAQYIGEYEERVYGAGNGIASMIHVMRGTEHDLQAAASLERMLVTAIDTYVAEWLGLTPEVQESLLGMAYRKALEAAQAAADAPYDSPATYQAALDALEQAREDLQDFVTAIDPLVTDKTAVCVRSLDGRTLFRHVTPDEALRRLPRGLYLFGGKKIYVR